MNLPRWPAGALPALLLCTALAGGSGPTGTDFPVLTLDASLLRVGPPRVTTAPADQGPGDRAYLPPHLTTQLAPSPLLPVPRLTQMTYVQPAGVVVRVYPVAALQALQGSRRGAEVRREVGTLRAINAGTLDPRTLIPPRGQAALTPFRALPYLFRPFEFQWAAGAVKRLTLPGGVRGLRYLVIRAGDTGYVPAEMAEYTFQGLSADGQFYVTLNAPYRPAGVLNAAQLNRTYTEQQRNSSDMAAYDAYALKVERQMDASTNAPTVRLLDRLVMSVQLR